MMQLMRHEKQLLQQGPGSPQTTKRDLGEFDTHGPKEQVTDEASASAVTSFCFLYASPLEYANIALGQLRVEDEVRVIEDALQGALSFEVDVATVGSIRKSFNQPNTWLHLSLHSLKSVQSQILLLESEGGGGHADKLHAADLPSLLQT
jgi:hypothetical protein